MYRVTIAGGGTAGLICAVILIKNNIKTDMYDRMASPGRKFLLAGMSGLNLTNNEDIDTFSSRYHPDEELFKKLLKRYSPQSFTAFLNQLGIETFTGSSGKLFPVSMKGDEPFRKILEYLEKSSLFTFYGNHCLIEIDKDNNLVFETRGNGVLNSERDNAGGKSPGINTLNEEKKGEECRRGEEPVDIKEKRRDFSENMNFNNRSADNMNEGESNRILKKVSSDAAVFALGGGSRKSTGSDGKWIEVFKRKGIKTVPFEPSNCGFEVAWSDCFREYLEASVPLKNISVSCGGLSSRNEILLTEYGVEGSGIYFLSRAIREKLKSAGKYGGESPEDKSFSGNSLNESFAEIADAADREITGRKWKSPKKYHASDSGKNSGYRSAGHKNYGKENLSAEDSENCILKIDLLPDLSPERIRKKLEKVKGKKSLSNYLRKTLSINKVKFRLMKELLSQEQFSCVIENPEILKNLSIEISGIRPLEEAISSAGGVSLEELDNNMMLKKIPGFYTVGEMAGWEAPTGGYLMQGCFSTASAAAESIVCTMNIY